MTRERRERIVIYVLFGCFTGLFLGFLGALGVFGYKCCKAAALVADGYHDYPAEIVTPLKVYCVRSYEIRSWRGANASGGPPVIIFTDEVGEMVVSDTFSVTRLDED